MYKTWPLLVVLALFLFCAGCDTDPAGAPLPPPPTNTSPSLDGDLSNDIQFNPNVQITTNGDTVTIVVVVTNTDTKTHYVAVQANFYRVPLSQLGDDSATYFVTSGRSSGYTMRARETRNIVIQANHYGSDPIVSVNLRATGE